jgi:hypothetical protein
VSVTEEDAVGVARFDLAAGELLRVEARVQTTVRQQFRMSAALHNPARLDGEDHVGAEAGGEPVRRPTMKSVTISGPTHTLIQLTDLHLVAEGDTLPGGVDTAALLGRALQAVAGAALGPDGGGPSALVLTGDIICEDRARRGSAAGASAQSSSQRRMACVCSPTSGIGSMRGGRPGSVIGGRSARSGPAGEPTSAQRSRAAS